MGRATGRALDEGTAVGKMAATLRASGWWHRWLCRLSARDGSRMLLLFFLLGSGQGPRQVGAGQTFEYLKREHSLSKPYQGEAPGARWSSREVGRVWGPLGHGPGGMWPGRNRRHLVEALGDSRPRLGSHRSRGHCPSRPPRAWKFPVGRGGARRCL